MRIVSATLLPIEWPLSKVIEDGNEINNIRISNKGLKIL